VNELLIDLICDFQSDTDFSDSSDDDNRGSPTIKSSKLLLLLSFRLAGLLISFFLDSLFLSLRLLISLKSCSDAFLFFGLSLD